MEKIKNAEKLVKPEKIPSNKVDVDTYNSNLKKGLQIYNKLCLSDNLSPEYRLKVLRSFVKFVPDEGNDMLSRLQDSLRFLKGPPLENLVKILVGVTRSSDFDSHRRVVTAVTLYNNCFFNVCYGCIADLANDRSVLVDYRVEAARYLFGSEIEDNIQASQEALLEVIDTDLYPSEYRYKIIAGFISRTGISTRLNYAKLKVPYDEDFVYGLQTNFFFNSKNGHRERILSGQHMLQMKCVKDDEKKEVGDAILEIASDPLLEANIRADAADVLLREGTPDQRKKAREVIIDLGFSPTGTRTLADKAKTIYSDSQNVHNETISKCIETFIEKIINETDVKIRPYHEVHQEVCDLVRKTKLEPKEKHLAYKALNRVSIDTATFTKYRINIAEIFVHVWIRIQKYKDEQLEELEKRMVEELVDMADTCSSGHSGRFINVLSIYDDTIRISWDDQIKSNIVGRLNAKIRDIKDEELQAQVSLGMLEDADEDDKKAYTQFIEKTLKDIKEELHGEFVGEGYVKEKEFLIAFAEGTKDL